MKKFTQDDLTAVRGHYGDDDTAIMRELHRTEAGVSSIALVPIYDEGDGSGVGVAVVSNTGVTGDEADTVTKIACGMMIMARDLINASNIAMVTKDNEMLKIVREFHEALKDYAKEKAGEFAEHVTKV